MTASYPVRTTPRFDRLIRRLHKGHPDLTETYAKALGILQADPYNRDRTHSIKKLEGIQPGEGQFRLWLGRWRFRYDIIGQEVILHYGGLRREETYR